MPDRARPAHPSARARRRRLAAEQRAHSARLLVCDCCGERDAPLVASVRGMGYDPVACTSLADLLREAAREPFDALLVSLPAVEAGHERLLQLLRRSQPSTPVVVVCADASLEARARIQAVRPYFVAVPPLRDRELCAILSGALGASTRA
jgi:DNA-binding NtrC family response regulator